MVNEPTAARSDLREALIAAATRIAAKAGYSQVKARDLSKEVGCAVGTIYNVFPDIDALIVSVKARMLDALETEVQAQLGPFVDHGPEAAAQRFGRLAEIYLDFAAEHWGLWSAMFEHRMAKSAALDAYMARLEVILTNIEQPLGALLPNLPIEARNPLARTLFAAVHGVVSLGLDGKLGTLPRDALRAQVKILLGATLRGLRGAEISVR